MNAHYTDQGFSVKFFGTGSIYMDDPTVGFFLSERHDIVIVFGFSENFLEKLETLITINTKKIIFYIGTERTDGYLGIEKFLATLKEKLPEIKIELYASLTGVNVSNAVEGFNLNRKKFLTMLYSNPNLKIILTGYFEWSELRSAVDILNIAIPDGPRVFLAEEF